MTLRLQLTIAKKGNLSVSDYYHQLKHTVATLAVASHLISDYEFTSYLLGNLGSEYDPFVTSVTTRVGPLSIDTLFGHLLAHESRIAKRHQDEARFPLPTLPLGVPISIVAATITKPSSAPSAKGNIHGGVFLNFTPFLLEVRGDLWVPPLFTIAQIIPWALLDPAHIWDPDPHVRSVAKWAIRPSLVTFGSIKPTRLLAQI